MGLGQLLRISLLKLLRVGEAMLKLPDGSRISFDLDQAPEILSNILHIYYYMDYGFVSDALPRAGWRVIDAGAYLGAYTLWSARMVGSSGEVVALEPHPRNLKLLEKNVRLNGLRNVRILPYALSGHDGECILYSPRYRALASLRREHAEGVGGEVLEEVRVRCITLRTLFEVLDLDRVDLLKLDIEGLEYEVLRSSIDLLDRVDRVVVEVHLDVRSLIEIEDLLKARGFKPFIKLDTLAENQAFIIALRD
ncbi:MAG: hypothetical protein DRJ69_05010 [Thermoprotei archaeon]|nr:MAG: hypothetical protein DRJ69_05010 [Thermoprotei archaeon]